MHAGLMSSSGENWDSDGPLIEDSDCESEGSGESWGGGGEGGEERREDSEQWEESERWEGSDLEEDDFDEAGDVEEAGGMLVKVLLSLLFAGSISAKMVCVICWWAWRAGCRSQKVIKMAHKPTAPSGHYQRRIDRVLGVSTKKAAYRIDLPLYIRGGISRRQVSTPVELGYERLLTEIEGLPNFERDLKRTVAEGALPPSYYTHEAHKQNTCGVCLYMFSGMTFSNRS